jgi:hypothetical protein
MAEIDDWVAELERRSGVNNDSNRQSDIEKLRGTNADDLGRVKEALEAQYAERARSNRTGEGTDSAERTRQGYGSGRGETADDTGKYTDAYGNTRYGTSGTGSGTSGYGGGSGGGSGSAGAWANTAGGMFPDWYRSLIDKNLSGGDAARAENKARADSLFNDLLARTKQGLIVDRNDAAIRGQADAYSANQRRAQRNFLSDEAERGGPYQNLQGERRMAAERYGANTAEYEAGLVGQERDARRAEIQNAFQMVAGLLSGDQARELQMNLALMGAAGNEAGLGVQMRGQDQSYDLGLKSNDLGLRNLGLQDWDRQMYWDMIRRGVI